MNELQPLISVIVPVFNASGFLNDTLNSIVSQTYENLEIILVNDGSTDDSGAICDRWAQKDARIRVLHQENGGPSKARNAALDIADGELIMFCDSDDLLSPKICQRLFKALGKSHDIAICDYVHIFEGQSYEFTYAPEVLSLTPAEVVKQMWYQTNFIPSACGKLFRRDIFRQLRFAEGLFFEDIDLLHLVFFKARQIAYAPAGLYGYVHHQGSITTAEFSLRDLDILKVIDDILEFAEAKPELLPAAQAYACTAALRIFLNAPNYHAYAKAVAISQTLLRLYGHSVAADPNCRKKTRYALKLYRLSKPLLRFVYKHINRWK